MKAASNQPTILLGEDDSEVRSYLATALECHGFRVQCAEDGNEIVHSLHQFGEEISAVLLDITMPHKDGMEALRDIRRFDQDLPVIMLSNSASPLTVVEAMRNGATDFLGKPVSHEELCDAVERALAARDDSSNTAAAEPRAPVQEEVLLAGYGRMKEIRTLLERIGTSDIPVLIQGETGVGKEVLARRLHAQSARSQHPFFKLNCAALPSELVESELFGYDRGAFTGAFQKKSGMFELADGGTLLLDEIGDMDFSLQAKLLQVLQDQEFHRLGGKETVRVNVRVLAATHCNLQDAIAEGRFREDLYYRLNVVNIVIPPLRERRDEILPLARLFIKKHNGVEPPPAVTGSLARALQEYPWPGNVRELENVIRRFLLLRDSLALANELQSKTTRLVGHSQSTAAEQPVRSAPSPASQDGASILEQVNMAKQQVEIEAILSALETTRWNRKQAAALLKIDYKALLYKMKKFSIDKRAIHYPAGAAPSRSMGVQ